jgi:ComEC/Rec2-related protein
LLLHHASKSVSTSKNLITGLLHPSVQNAIARKVFVPSLFIFLSVSSAILIACSYGIDGSVCAAGIGILVLALLSFLPVYRNTLRVETDTGHSRFSGSAARTILILVIAFSCSAHVSVRISGLMTREAPVLGSGEWIAHVESSVRKRYYREAVISFRRHETAGGLTESESARHCGVARVTGGEFSTGDTISFAGKPAPVSLREEARLSSTRSLLLKGIRYVFYLDGGKVSIVSGAPSFREKARDRLAENCDMLFNRETAAMVKALYFGNEDYIDKLTMNDFKRAGVFHLLSAGGLHVAVVAAIPVFLLGLIRVNRKMIAAVAALSVVCYLCLTDMPVSLLRSCVMFCMYALQRMADREVNIFNALFLSAAALLVLFPGEIFGLGFQLSYGATLGILFFHNTYSKTLSWMPAVIAGPVALTLSAQLLVLPVLLVRVHELNLAGLISNIIVVPLMSLLLIISFAANALSLFTPAGAWAGHIADMIYWLGVGIVRYMSGLDGHYYVEAPGLSLVAAFILLIVPLAPFMRRRRIMSLFILAAILTAWLPLGSLRAPGREPAIAFLHNRGTLLLVKRGLTLSVIGRYPEKRHMERLLNEIASFSCRDVMLYLPQADYENLSGCSYLLRRLPVRRCYLSGGFRIRGFMRRFFTVLEQDGVELVIHDCGLMKDPAGPGIRPGEEEDICRMYANLSPDGAMSRAGEVKQNNIRYLILH